MNTGFNERILINSMPKSGTHLLSRAVGLLGIKDFGANRPLWRRWLAAAGMTCPARLIHETVSGRRSFLARLHLKTASECDKAPVGVLSPVGIPLRRLRKWLQSVPCGHYLTGHVPWSESFDHLLQKLGFKHIVIVRDPRDVLVSFLHFVSRPGHALSGDFNRLSGEARWTFALSGGRSSVSSRNIRGLREAVQSVLDWKKSRHCLLVRFEDLVGAKGGGSASRQRAALQSICDYLEISSGTIRLDDLCERLYDPASRTFRRGQVGSWRDELSGEAAEEITRLTADLCREVNGI